MLALTTLHPDFVATAQSRNQSRDLFTGNEAVRARGGDYLLLGKNETGADHARRLRLACVDTWVEKIVTARQALMWASGAARELPEPLEALADDVDNLGNTADTFFYNVTRDAQIDGVAWVLVDRTALPPDTAPPRSLQGERELGIRTFFQQVPANSVIDWETDDAGELQWAVIRECTYKPRPQWGMTPEPINRYKVWTRSEWILYEAASLTAEPKEIVRGSHALGVVPLVAFLGIPRTNYSGYPICRGVLGHIILAYNKKSDLDWFEHLGSHPIPVVIAASQPQKIDVGGGLFVRTNAGESASVTYLETSGAGFESLRKSIEAINTAIFSMALSTAKKASAQVQSAESQREDGRVFAASLDQCATRNERGEAQCWRLAGMWEGNRYAPEQIKVKHNHDFDDSIIEAGMIMALSGLADANHITRETLLQTLRDGGILPPDFDIPAELLKLAEQDAAAAARTLEMFGSKPDAGVSGGEPTGGSE